MDYVSTRGEESVSLDAALVSGIAADGGLYMPTRMPHFDLADFDEAEDLPAVARVLLAPFFEGSKLEPELDAIVNETYSFPIPLVELPAADSVLELLELYHGPTAAFKDVGARFLSACMRRLEGDVKDPLTILVATSGDTGGAVAAAFDRQPGMRVVVLFPAGRVSERQAHQLSCWSENVLSLRVAAAFDDCQAMVKTAMADPTMRRRYRFSSANSINIGRLLPQSTYYAFASLVHYRKHGRAPSFVIPTGNLGNALACVMAREMGLPIESIVLSTNANRTIPDYFETLEWLPRSSVQTLASAMDVGNPSNMERLRALLGDADVLKGRLGVRSVTDDEIRDEVRRSYEDFGFALCPHTATAARTWRDFDSGLKRDEHWILVGTAHPAKFETVVEPLVQTTIPLPPELAEILERPANAVDIEASQQALYDAMDSRFGATST